MPHTARQHLFGRSLIAKRLGRHSVTVLRAFESGRLRGVKAGIHWMATLDDLVKWLGRERAEQLFGKQAKTASVDTRRRRSVGEDSETLGSKPSCRAPHTKKPSSQTSERATSTEGLGKNTRRGDASRPPNSGKNCAVSTGKGGSRLTRPARDKAKQLPSRRTRKVA